MKPLLKSDETMETIAMYDHLERMQVRIMAKDSMVTWEQFAAEPYQARVDYYNWMRRQIGELADLIQLAYSPLSPVGYAVTTTTTE